MNIIEKLKVIDSFTDIPSTEPVGNQSIKFSFQCGCYFIQHGYAGKSCTDTMSELGITNRNYFVELCKTHKNELRKSNEME